MRIVFFGNNKTAYEILRWLVERDEEIVGLVVHPKSRQKSADEIMAVSGLPKDAIFSGDRLNTEKTFRQISALNPEIGVSIYFGYILNERLIDIFPKGCINLHPAYLPYNRGAYPNVWSIIEETPAGCTLHYIDKWIDSGDIVARKKVPVKISDNGQTLYNRIEKCCVDLFKRNWQSIKSGTNRRTPQKALEGSSHTLADVTRIDHIQLEQKYKAKDLINILRARTFPPHTGAYIISKKGKKVYLRLNLIPEKSEKTKDHHE